MPNNAQAIATREVLHAAYDMLGDGEGQEWWENEEYTRAVVEFVGNLLPIGPELIDRGGDAFKPFVLGMVYAAHLLGTEGE